MLRTILCGLYLIWYFIMSLPFILYQETAGRRNPDRRARQTSAFVNMGFRQLQACAGMKINVIGHENVPKDKPVLYICNHRSYFDIVTLFPLTYPVTGFVAKKQMEKIPLLSNLMRYVHCEFLDRDNIREGMKSILRAIDTVKAGNSMVIFPEGTRNHGSELLEFKQGSFKIAERSGCPVVPVAVSNADDVFENHMPFVKGQHIVIEFGKPILIGDLPQEEKRHIAPYVQGIISDMLHKNSRPIAG